jgi:hypothetical protein
MGAPKGNCNACKGGGGNKKRSVSYGAKRYLKINRHQKLPNSLRRLTTRLKSNAYSKFLKSLN